jgi:uncharacterized membrane protein YgcG
LGHGITMIIKESFIGSWQLCSTPSFRFFENYPTGICVFQHHISRKANEHWNHKKFEDLILCTVGKLHPWSNSRKSTESPGEIWIQDLPDWRVSTKHWITMYSSTLVNTAHRALNPSMHWGWHCNGWGSRGGGEGGGGGGGSGCGSSYSGVGGGCGGSGNCCLLLPRMMVMLMSIVSFSSI